MERIHGSGNNPKHFRAMHLVAKVLMHVVKGTENTSAGMHSREMMREGVRELGF
jgi:hypothetical protein